MMRILIGDEQVYLDPGFTIRLDMIFPAFEDEFDYSSIVYPFSIPAPPNEELFNFSNHVVINNKTRMYDCQLIFAGSLRMSAKLVLSKLSGKQFRGSIIVNRFSTDYKEKLLSEFDYDGNIILGATTAAVIAHVNGIVLDENPGPHLKYNFPEIKAPVFYGDENENNPAFCGILNRWHRGNQSVQPNNIGTSLDNQNTESLLPCPYLLYVLEKCFQESGYDIFGSLLDDTELQSLLMLNNYPLDLIEKLYYVRANNSIVQVVNPSKNINADDDYTPPNEDIHDIWEQEEVEAQYPWRYHIQTEGYHQVSMEFKSKYTYGYPTTVVRISMVKYNDGNPTTLYYRDFDFLAHQTWYERTVDFSHYFPIGDVGDYFYFTARFFDPISSEDSAGEFQVLDLIITNLSASGLNTFAKTLHIKNHVPGISLGNLVNALKKGFGTIPFYSHDFKEVQFSTYQEILESNEYLDLSDQCIKDSTEIELKDAEGYKLNFEFDSNDPVTQDNFVDHSIYELIGSYSTYYHLPIPDGLNKIALVLNTNVLYFYGVTDEDAAGWSIFSDSFYDYLIGDGKKEVKIAFSPVMMNLETEGGDVLTIRPYTKLLASSPAFGTGLNEFGFQLMFFRGMQSDAFGLYPVGSSMAYSPFGDDIANSELQFPGDKGLIANFLQGWYDFINNSETIKKNFDVSPDLLYEIMQLFAPQHGRQKRKILVDGVKYIPKKFSFILRSNSIEKAEATLIKKGNITV